MILVTIIMILMKVKVKVILGLQLIQLIHYDGSDENIKLESEKVKVMTKESENVSHPWPVTHHPN